MPEVARVAQADRLAVLDHVRDDQHLGMVLQRELVQHVALQRAEAAGEGHLLGGADVLVAEHQHVVVQETAVHAGEIRVAQRLAQVDADDFGAQGRVESADLEGLPGLGRLEDCCHGRLLQEVAHCREAGRHGQRIFFTLLSSNRHMAPAGPGFGFF